MARHLTTPHRPDPIERLFFFLSGAVISIPFPALANGVINNYLLMSYSSSDAFLLASSIAAPIFEEFAKAYPLFYRHGETQRSIISLGFLCGLGFGVAEFLLYVFAFGVPPLARLPLILFHASLTTIASYGISRNRSFPFFLLAVTIHGLYNFTIESINIVAYSLVIFSYLLALTLFKSSREVIYTPYYGDTDLLVGTKESVE